MPAFHPRPDSLPEEIAVFPLTGALLLPQGRLPLNIFEPRYLALVQDSLCHGRLFGMIQPDPAAAKASPSVLYGTGCLGRVSSFSETEDGRLLITLTGLLRFQVRQELPLHPDGYRRVRADYRPWLADLDSGGAEPPIDRPALMSALRPYFQARRIEANWEAIEKLPDPMLVTTLAMVCPFDPREKQALLEAPTPEDRARTLVALLQMDAFGGPDAPPSGRPS
ncbi:LON peptidase substrate-binding domain-containing protein [Roseomonas gilardii]|uniref:LON peptidase substrate-binding domain-containing protein n=1 Tax=Roseomonas gilardii TaxID=257708 RepID=UPI000483C30A|nr:LON peptidase substrate-binding domain-containing protein [Roseomonas gilardii]SUE62855.1 Lon protease 2 [Roseomonas gilardii subsp. rosea]